MLRAVVVALLAANLLLWCWMQGWLDGVIARPGQGEREPARMARQINPELIRLAPLPASGASAAPDAAADAAPGPTSTLAPELAAPAADTAALEQAAAARTAAPPVCLQAGPFSAQEAAAVERSMREQRLAGIEWRSIRAERGGVYLVYLGKFADRPAMLKRLEELRRAGVAAEELKSSPGLEPGLHLGRHSERAAAEAGLARVLQKGAKTARVLVITPPTPLSYVRVDQVDAAQAERLAATRLGGQAFKPCTAPGG
jgi:SPOR domain